MPLSGSAFWAVIVPVGDRTNLLLNPDFERGTAGAAAIQSATLGSAANVQQFGAWSLSVAPNSNGTSGAALGTWTAGNGTDYTVSAYVRGVNGVPYMLGVGDSSGLNLVGSTAFTGGGTWQRYTYAFTESAGAVRRLVVRKTSGNDTGTFYVDGQQAEAGSLTTFVSGDLDGCYWTGVPHASQSVRSGTYRGGGSVVALADLGLKPDDAVGIGMPPQDITSQSYALLPGAEYQRSRAAERPFNITFKPIVGTTLQGYHVTRRTLINALKPDLLDPQQPVRFWYTGGQGTVQLDAVYAGGLELGQMDGPMAEAGAIKFIAHDPYWYATTQEGTALAPRTALGSANYIVKRDILGRWGTLGANGSTIQGIANAVTGPDVQAIVDMAYNSGTLFFCGSFGTVAGTAYNDIGMYYPALNTFGTLVGGTLGTSNVSRTVRSLYYAPWGSLYIGGDFIKAGGTVATAIAQWNGGGFGTLIGGTITAAGANGTSVRAMDMLGGTLFFTGRFTDIGGTTAGSIAMWRGNTFGTLSGGVNGIMRGLVVGLDNAVYVAGAGAAGGTTVNGVARWNGAWGSMGTGVYGGQSLAAAIASEPNGKIVIAGGFSNTDVGSVYNVAEWNGQQWSNLGSGVYDGAIITNTWVTSALADPLTGDIYLGGAFNYAGGLKTPDGVARWNGYAWLPLDVDVSGQTNGTFQALLLAPDRTLFAAGSFAGTAYAAAVAQVTNTGIGEAYPTVKIRTTSTGTARIYQIVNTYTGDGIWLNYAIQPGEEITLETTPGARSLTSSAFGNIFGKIIPGSNITGLRLMPGTNYMSLFCDTDNVAASIYWQPRHDSIDGGTIY